MTIVFRLSTSFSTWISWLAIVSAAEVYCVAFVASPAFSASAAMISAWRALPLSFSSSVILAFSRSSPCFWLAMTLAACSRSRRCWFCASAIACSSCTFGSARSLNDPVSLAVRYFHHFLNSLNMAAILCRTVDRRGGRAAAGAARQLGRPQGARARRRRRPTRRRPRRRSAATRRPSGVVADPRRPTSHVTSPASAPATTIRHRLARTSRSGKPGTLYDSTCSAHSAQTT